MSAMGVLFGGSTTENEDRIERLEDELEDVNRKAKSAQNSISILEDRVQEQRESLLTLVEAVQSGVGSELEDKNDVVETVEEPKVVWKAVEDGLAKLLIPEGATVVHPDHQELYINNTIHKKRTDEAVVLALYDYNDYGSVGAASSAADISTRTADESRHTRTFGYTVGETVEPRNSLDTNTSVECTDGIHFFCTKSEAKQWY